MRNLKRTLCLALSTAMVAVMMLGTMVIGASAVSYDDLLDKDQIVHEEAVATMNALGLIEGRDNGTFDPTANITRAEMCKVITLALHGGTDPVLSASNSTFWDTEGHWAELYIEYCAANGIIAGRGDGSFDPNSNITGTEAAKMILVALGYKSDVFYFTGPDWAINVDTRANDSHARLYEGLSGLNSGAAINRDNAAQLLYNGVINAQLLEMSPQQSITTGEVSYQWRWTGTSMLNEEFDASIYEGVILANEYAGVSGYGIQPEGQFRLQIILKDDQSTGSDGKSVVGNVMLVAGETTPDMLGKSYKIIIKNSQKGGVYTTVYGEPTLSDRNNIYTISADKTDISASSFEDELRAAGISALSYSGDNQQAVNAKVYMNLAQSTKLATSDTKVNALREEPSMAKLQAATSNGRIIEVIDYNNDGNADYILISNPYIGKVSSYNPTGNNGAGYITISSLGKADAETNEESILAAKFEKVVGVENLAKDDIVSYVKLPDGKFYVTKLDSVSGTINKTTGTNTVVLDSTTYKESGLGDNFDEKFNKDLKTAVALGEEAVLYLDASGYVVYVSAVNEVVQYLYVSELEALGTISGVRAKVVFSDGTQSVINITSVTDISGNNYTPQNSTKEANSSGKNLLNWYDEEGEKQAVVQGVAPVLGISQIYKYSEKNGDYSLTKPSTVTTIKSGGSIYQSDAGLTYLYDNNEPSQQVGVQAGSSTVFVVKAGNNWSVYTGVANVPDLEKITAGEIAEGGNGIADVIFVEGTTQEAQETKSIYILSSDITAVKNGNKTTYTVKALVDGEYVGDLALDKGSSDSHVDTGLYTGSGVKVSNSGITVGNYTTSGNSDEKVYYNAPAELTQVLGTSVTGLIAASDGTPAKAAGTLTVTADTKIILITGSEKDEVLMDGTIDDLNYNALGTDNNNGVIVMTRASNTEYKTGFYQAGIIYVILNK